MPINKLLVGNWKMNLSSNDALRLSERISALMPQTINKVVICPNFVYLENLIKNNKNPLISHGAQDCHHEKNGAYTGDVSAYMLKEVGCSYVILGHSERRKHHKESNSLIKQKAEIAIEAGLIPVICVGETLEEREFGKADEVVYEQLEQSMPSNFNENCVIAYEPVWAIGTGIVAEEKDIADMHRKIYEFLYKKTGFNNTYILYGGSVTPENAKAITDCDCVNGLLIGGSSLSAEKFLKIIGVTSC
jgi:triosephosphate isomerase (TIM)